MCSDFLSNGHDHLPLFFFPSSSTLFQALLLPSNDNKQIASGLSDRKQKLAALPLLDGSIYRNGSGKLQTSGGGREHTASVPMR